MLTKINQGTFSTGAGITSNKNIQKNNVIPDYAIKPRLTKQNQKIIKKLIKLSNKSNSLKGSGFQTIY